MRPTMPPKAKAYWDKASQLVAHMPKGQRWVIANKDSPELAAWRAYFDRQGWQPFMIRELDKGRIDCIAVPTQWPEWFDREAQAA
jgi:hypothetical protein